MGKGITGGHRKSKLHSRRLDCLSMSPIPISENRWNDSHESGRWKVIFRHHELLTSSKCPGERKGVTEGLNSGFGPVRSMGNFQG